MSEALLYFLAGVGGFFIGIGLHAFLKGIRQGIAKHRAEKATPPRIAKDCLVHTLIPLDAQPLNYNDIAHTAVLMRCDQCSFFTTALFVGSWPIETFLKKESDAARDIVSLERMAK